MTATAPAHWHAIEQVREGLEEGCAFTCGCDDPGNPSKCIRTQWFAALGLLQELAEAADGITFAIWANSDEERDAASRLRSALARVRDGATQERGDE